MGVKEIDVQNLFPDIIQELHLQKKRLSSGIYYYGIVYTPEEDEEETEQTEQKT
jgi:hypothetical protein